MNTKKSMRIVLGIFIIAAWLLSSVPQAMAETMNIKFFSHVTKMEVFSIPDAENHSIVFAVGEGVSVLETGELGWLRSVSISDTAKGLGTFSMYTTHAFQDGASITTRTKGTIEATGSKWTGEIIHGTGRFQGIKGTLTSSSKRLPAEKGELAGKAIGQATWTYTLPPK
jgi:hypothetical protein